MLAAAALLAAPPMAPGLRAQPRFPDRPIRMIVPYSAGGSTDAQMRALCEAAGKRLGQQVITENRSGGGGIMGAQLLASGTRPDGYTLAQMPVSVFRHPWVSPRPAFDPLADFTYVAQITGYLYGVVVKADAPWATLEAALAFARGNPGGFSYATTGVGSSMDMCLQDIARKAEVEFTHVPFRGSAESLQALLGRQISAVATSSDWARAILPPAPPRRLLLPRRCRASLPAARGVQAAAAPAPKALAWRASGARATWRLVGAALQSPNPLATVMVVQLD